ncbi:MAG TPA: 16S rRNA (adenine(1518)-N(6)/adenine(1519)-N(6))-dimethyltransferase RsmA [Candidatus Saccharimonadales bacterium]|nr:16S rRNA (adenine(1518)-N(6)/adenine(1519)-N(6))-dimethyltransferase RsmA [Candidatus Saccharimonadales bacterium]
MNLPKKSLGQHWLKDTQALEAIVEAAEIKPTDTVLEIGPGLGHLTQYLVGEAEHVVAVELDEQLASRLLKRFAGKNISIHAENILEFDLTQLPEGYKVVANIPYYLTSNLLQVLSESSNPPHLMVLLLQKEVAQRITAKPGSMSVLSVSVQLYYNTDLRIVVPAKLFEPPPKVDSQVVILHRQTKPLFHDLDIDKFFNIVKAGFSERRKKLRSSLSGGLHISKDQADELLQKAGIDGDLRAQNLSLRDWHRIYLASNLP